MIGLCALLLSAPLLLFAAEPFVPPDSPVMTEIIAPALHGYVAPEGPVAFSPSRVAQGAWQRDVSGWFSRHLPLRGWMIRLNNQLDLWLFRHSAADRGVIVVGPGGALNNADYINVFYGLVPRRPAAEFATLADRIGLLAQRLRAQGTIVAVVLTPSKPALYPQTIPYYFTDRRGAAPTAYDDFSAIFRQSGLNFVDGYALLAAKRSEYAFPLFPRGGVHWNSAGAFLATSALAETLGRTRAEGGPLTPRLLSLTVDQVPTGNDRDLLDLMNLLFPDDHYPVPHVDFVIDGQSFHRKAVFVGDSFSSAMIEQLLAAQVFPKIEFYSYYDFRHATCPPCVQNVKTGRIDWQKDVFDSDAIVIEMNEGQLGGTDPMYALRFVDDALAALDRTR